MDLDILQILFFSFRLFICDSFRYDFGSWGKKGNEKEIEGELLAVWGFKLVRDLAKCN